MIYFLTPNQAGGVLDYATLLGSAVGAQLVPYSNAAQEFGNGSIELSKVTIFVQYSGYGFQKRGVPLSLLRLVQHLKSKGARIGTFFHELYAHGWPWNSSFWLSPVQKWLCAELARHSDFWITNRVPSAEWLVKVAGNKPHAMLPVFSNVGEPICFHSDRASSLVVFGSARSRMAVYSAAGKQLFDWVSARGLNVVDIGPPIADHGLTSVLEREGVRKLGRLSAPEVSDILSTAAAGVVAYPLDFVSKSSIFAAYAAHGVVPIVLSTFGQSREGLQEGRHFVSWPWRSEAQFSMQSEIGRAAYDWYQDHAIAMHQKVLCSLIKTGICGTRSQSTTEFAP